MKLFDPSANLPHASSAEPSAGLGVLEKAMGLLNIVSGSPTPLTFTELLKTSGFPKPIKFGAAQQCSARWLLVDVDQWINDRRGVAA